ncbi:MAG: hypothetical protein A2Y07_03885 [Planctomycetes bacterium GWF2_50_10]|nr:MAG: hypothetical protein A2Y07_03885 [Planctomycetes bacterium GWF2_50_10]
MLKKWIICSAVILMMITVYVAGCGDNRNSGDAVTRAYTQGKKDAEKEILGAIKSKEENLKTKVRNYLRVRMIPLSIFAAFMVLIGTRLLEGLRDSVSNIFMLTPARQAELAMHGYLVANALTLLWIFFMEDALCRVPSLILLAAGVVPFAMELYPGLRDDVPEQRRSGLTKLKTLGFLLLVVVFSSRIATGGLSGIIS